MSKTHILLMGPEPDGVDIRYKTGFTAPDPFFYLYGRYTQSMLISSMEKNRAATTAPGVSITSYDELQTPKKAPTAVRLAEWLKKKDVKAVDVSFYFPAGLLQALRKLRIRVDVRDGPLFDRSKKTSAEIECIIESQRAAVAAMKRVKQWFHAADVRRTKLYWDQKPLTAERVRREIAQVLLQHDCLAEDIIVAGGPDSADPHCRGSGPLYAGQPIVVDIFPRHTQHGYWGDLTRTYVIGEAPPVVKAMHRAVRHAQSQALDMIRARVSARAVHRAVHRSFEQAGFPWRRDLDPPKGFIHGAGHGVGLNIHEAPSLSDGNDRLAAGQAVTVEPGLYDPDIGGVRIEDTVFVTSDGYSCPATLSKQIAP